MDKKFTYKDGAGAVTFSSAAFPGFTQNHLDRLAIENEPVAVVLKALNAAEEKNRPRPVFIATADDVFGDCPACGELARARNDNKIHYCNVCGQALYGASIKSVYTFKITHEYVRATDTDSNEITEVGVAYPNDTTEVKCAALDLIDKILSDFDVKAGKLADNKVLQSENTAVTTASGSEDGGNE